MSRSRRAPAAGARCPRHGWQPERRSRTGAGSARAAPQPTNRMRRVRSRDGSSQHVGERERSPRSFGRTGGRVLPMPGFGKTGRALASHPKVAGSSRCVRAVLPFVLISCLEPGGKATDDLGKSVMTKPLFPAQLLLICTLLEEFVCGELHCRLLPLRQKCSINKLFWLYLP